MQPRARCTAPALALLLSLLASCGSPTSPLEHLRLTVALDRADVAVGTPVTVRVRLSNALVTGARTARVSGSSTCTFGFEVRTSGGTPLFPAEHACTDDLRTWSIEPGQHVERTYQWTPPVGTAPAAYVVVGLLESRELTARSAPATIHVRGAR